MIWQEKADETFLRAYSLEAARLEADCARSVRSRLRSLLGAGLDPGTRAARIRAGDVRVQEAA